MHACVFFLTSAEFLATLAEPTTAVGWYAYLNMAAVQIERDAIMCCYMYVREWMCRSEEAKRHAILGESQRGRHTDTRVLYSRGAHVKQKRAACHRAAHA